MPIGDHMIRTTLGGHIQGTQTWSCSFWMRISPTTDFLSSAGFNTFIGTLLPYCNTWASSMLSPCWASGTQYDTVHWAYYAASVHTPNLVAVSNPTPVVGTGTSFLPAFTAVVASLRSTLPGRGGRGRCYVPLTQATALSGAANQITSGTLTNISNGWKTLLNAFNAASAPAEITSHRVAIRSMSTGAAQDVATVIVDSMPDHQSRRQDKLVPSSAVSATLT